MNQRKRSVVCQLTPTESNRLTVSDTAAIDEPISGYHELMECRNSVRGHLTALENKRAIEPG